MKPRLVLSSNAVWPPPFVVWSFILSYGMVTAGLWFIERPLHINNALVSDSPEVKNIRMVILGMAAALYAFFRLVRFHPVCNQAHADWLKSTPWTAERPLPMGPVHPVFQDVILIAALMAIAKFHAHADPFSPAIVFFFIYLIGMTFLLAATRQWLSCLLLGFLWPTLMLPEVNGWTVAFLLVCIVIVIWDGHRRSLRSFPWNFRSLFNRPASSVFQTDIRLDFGSLNGAVQSSLGWPLMALSPKLKSVTMSQSVCISLAALFGWWSYCLLRSTNAEPTPELFMIFAFIAAFMRLGIYLNGTTAPFHFWARFVWGRILVPGYDQIFLTPVFVAIVGILGATLIKHSGSAFALSESGTFAFIWYLLLAGGPTLQAWALTGQHGFRPPSRTSANKQSLRPL